MNGMENQKDWLVSMNCNKELCTYLKENEFKEFMDAWKRQYIKYGQCKGSIHLSISDKNRSAIENLMGKDYYGYKEVKITFSQLKKALLTTRFSNCDFDQVLLFYFNHNVDTNKQIRKKKEETIDNFFQGLFELEGKSKAWIESVYDSKNMVYTRIVQEMKESQERCFKDLSCVMHALNHLPVYEDTKTNLSVFSSQYTKNPHAFDKGTFMHYCLFQGILYFLNLKKVGNSSLEENEILYQAGLYQDGISNYCSIARFNAYRKDGNLHRGWQGFYEVWESINVNMDNLLNVESIQKCHKVFIVENPSIFQALLKYSKERKIENIALVCTNGQLNYSAYLLLDKIQEANIPMFYSGDMDPEGLLIAQRLKRRYPSLHLWCYSVEDYIQSLSNRKASERRMQMLKQIEEKELLEIVDQMLKNEGMIGYQENILDVYLKNLSQEDVRKDNALEIC